ncbi:hypothetical protein ACU4GD_35500 [Cupriavidus basilensis]
MIVRDCTPAPGHARRGGVQLVLMTRARDPGNGVAARVHQRLPPPEMAGWDLLGVPAD